MGSLAPPAAHAGRLRGLATEAVALRRAVPAASRPISRLENELTGQLTGTILGEYRTWVSCLCGPMLTHACPWPAVGIESGIGNILMRKPLSIVVAAAFVGAAWFHLNSPSRAAPEPTTAARPDDAAAIESVNSARRCAEALHSAIHVTLHAVHRHYYVQNERLPLPAAIMEKVFADLEKDQGVALRWLVVQGQAMNVEHMPKDAFEQAAADALAAGKPAYEQVEAGIYRRAGAIILTNDNECLKCHVPDRSTLENRTAGLIVSIPLTPADPALVAPRGRAVDDQGPDRPD